MLDLVDKLIHVTASLRASSPRALWHSGRIPENSRRACSQAISLPTTQQPTWRANLGSLYIFRRLVQFFFMRKNLACGNRRRKRFRVDEIANPGLRPDRSPIGGAIKISRWAWFPCLWYESLGNSGLHDALTLIEVMFSLKHPGINVSASLSYFFKSYTISSVQSTFILAIGFW